ncbi:MAG: hypothetical protein GFH27_549379n42 [Chloroflexi bacterium AL-W]|nr:hypothetical protein [Chloroflexi bacterium AL-N1]NOK71166.1 hypothetical protein [Chloroflexi bacterium AL-N10]NOK78632.1 hypothetical protein [Chloroflexi bacterium AL-N5]NOK85928.1 hypothetical protein [Chloroflexi bacterium AL-W]NOK92903.1 hypothetical protein [Chloroflexi bacterium AL-N15]
MMQLIQHTVTRWMGVVLASMPFNRMARTTEHNTTFYLKKRHSYGWLPRLITNQIHTHFQVLSQREWFAREQHIYTQMYGKKATVEAGWLKLEALPGLSLDHILGNPHQPQPTKFRALAAAIRALQHLHEHSGQRTNHAANSFSHSDATIRNVTYDSHADQSWWFDFETVHVASRPLVWCFADDLRVLLYSAAPLLNKTEMEMLARLGVAIYPDVGVLRTLRQLAIQMRQRPDMFHFAQTRIDAQCNVLFSAILLRALNAVEHYDSPVSV